MGTNDPSVVGGGHEDWERKRLEARYAFVAPSRVVRPTDCSGREALISCGAVLDHFRVAMAAAGWTANINRFPNPINLLHVASIDFSPMEFVTEAHRRRANAILLRRTDRLPFAAPPNWQSFEPGLRDTVDSELVRLDVIADDLRPRLAEASQLTEAMRLYDSSYHAELQWWTAPFEVVDGIPHSALVSAAESGRVDVGRTFPVTGHQERRAEVDEDHSKILLLSTTEYTHESVLRCGGMLSAILLDATMDGLSTCTLTHITEVPASREIVAALIDHDAIPQVLIRVGLGRPSKPCHRRRRVDRSTTCLRCASDSDRDFVAKLDCPHRSEDLTALPGTELSPVANHPAAQPLPTTHDAASTATDRH